MVHFFIHDDNRGTAMNDMLLLTTEDDPYNDIWYIRPGNSKKWNTISEKILYPRQNGTDNRRVVMMPT